MRVRARPPQFVACLVVSIAAAGAFRVETSNLTARLQVPRSGHQATLLGDGRVLVTGGSDDRGMAIGVAEMFDPLTGVWTSAAANLVPRLGHSASLLHDGRVIVVGGLPFASACEPIGSAELYDASTDRWSMTSKIPVPVGLGTAVVSLKDGRVLVSGGGSGCGDVYSSAALFDPSSNTWSRTASMAAAAQFHVTALLEDGRALVSGASTSTYDAATATWAPLGDPRPLITAACEGDAQTYSRALRPDSVLARATPDNCPSVTVLPAGTLLVAGGQTAPDSAVQWVRLSDLATGEELPTWPMQVARMGHTATRLTNGAVLIAGGRDGDRRIASSELYIPRLAFEASLFGIPRGGSDPLGDYSYGEYLATATNSRDHLLISSTGGSGVATHLIEWDPWPWWEGPAARHRPGYRRFPHLRALGPGLPDLNSIRVDERDNIWGVSSTAKEIIKLNAEGKVLLRFGGKHVDSPSDVGLDGHGNVFVTDAGERPRVFKFSSRGRLLAAAGRKGARPGSLDTPHSLAIDAEGNVYVADSGNARIQVFDNGLRLRGVYCNIGTPWALCICRADPSRQFLYSASHPGMSDRPTRAAEVYKLDLDGTILGKAVADEPGRLTFLTLEHIHCRQPNTILGLGFNDRPKAGGLHLITFRR